MKYARAKLKAKEDITGEFGKIITKGAGCIAVPIAHERYCVFDQNFIPHNLFEIDGKTQYFMDENIPNMFDIQTTN